MRSQRKNSVAKAGGAQKLTRRVDLRTTQESYFSSLKDQIELLKVLALAMGMVTAAHIVVTSQLDNATRILGAITCVVLGVWIGTCGVVVYFRHRLRLGGLSIRWKAWRISQYLIVMCAMLFAFRTSVAIAKSNQDIKMKETSCAVIGGVIVPANVARHWHSMLGGVVPI